MDLLDECQTASYAPILFLLYPFPISDCCFTHVSHITFPVPLFHSPLNTGYS